MQLRPGEDLRMTLWVLPPHRLPPGFPTSLGDPPDPPVTPRPAATLCLLREGPEGFQTLLLRRSPRTRFIPGTYVFPGGSLDPEDEAPELLDRLRGGGVPPPLPFWVAALRETFEETGVLLAASSDGAGPQRERRGRGAPDREQLAVLRERLLKGELTFQALLEEMDATLNAAALTPMGHWITPVSQPLRYDTRFFAARITGDEPIELHEPELTEALWLTPAQALGRNHDGSLPLAFPTLRTLEEMALFPTPEEALEEWKERPVLRRLPRLVETEEGVGIQVDE